MVRWHGHDVYELRHSAFESDTAIQASPAWRDASAAQRFGLSFDQFKAMPVDSQAWMIAWYEVNWRIEALQRWEVDQRIKAEQNRNQ